MSSVWKLVQSLAISSVIFTSIFPNIAIANPQVGSLQLAQASGDASAKRQLDPRTNISFEGKGCTRRGDNVTCEVIATNFNDMHRTVRFGASYEDYQTRIIDPKGNVFVSTGVQMNSTQKRRDRITTDLAPGVPAKLIYSFKVPRDIQEISAIDVGYLALSRIDVLSRTTLSNVGTISTNTASSR